MNLEENANNTEKFFNGFNSNFTEEEENCDEICDIMSTPVAELEMRESIINGFELPISTISTGAGYIISIPGLKWTKIHDEALRERIHSFVVGEIDFLKQFTSEQNYNPF